MSKVLQVVYHPNEVLRKKAEKVEVFDKELSELAANMATTMYHYRGIGLAANQVNVLKRIFILDVNWRDPTEDEKKVDKKPEVFINPEILSETGQTEYEEG